MNFLSVLSFKVGYAIKLNDERASHFQFGFEQNGTYQISVGKMSSSDGIAIALANEEELLSLRNSFPSKFSICSGSVNITSNSALFADINESSFETFNGTIHKKGIYTVIYQSCSYIVPFSFTVYFNFKNPNSNLDYRWMPILKETPIAIALFIVLTIAWIFNWLTHFQTKAGLHYFITTTLVLIILIQGFRYGMFQYNLTHDTGGGFSVVLEIVKALFHFVFCCLFILASKGWCIIMKKIKKIEIIKTLLVSGFFAVLYSLTNNLQTNILITVFLLLSTSLALALLLVELFKSAAYSEKIISARLCAYADQGIDPKTTPFYRKYKMMRYTYVLIYCVVIFPPMSLFAVIFLDDNFWIDYLIDDINNLIFLAGFVFIFWIHGHNSTGYLQVGEDMESDDFSDEDIQINSQIFEEQLNKGGRAWQDGDKVPKIKRTTQMDNTNDVEDTQKDLDKISQETETNSPVNEKNVSSSAYHVDSHLLNDSEDGADQYHNESKI